MSFIAVQKYLQISNQQCSGILHLLMKHFFLLIIVVDLLNAVNLTGHVLMATAAPSTNSQVNEDSSLSLDNFNETVDFTSLSETSIGHTDYSYSTDSNEELRISSEIVTGMDESSNDLIHSDRSEMYSSRQTSDESTIPNETINHNQQTEMTFTQETFDHQMTSSDSFSNYELFTEENRKSSEFSGKRSDVETTYNSDTDVTEDVSIRSHELPEENSSTSSPELGATDYATTDEYSVSDLFTSEIPDTSVFSNDSQPLMLLMSSQRPVHLSREYLGGIHILFLFCAFSLSLLLIILILIGTLYFQRVRQRRILWHDHEEIPDNSRTSNGGGVALFRHKRFDSDGFPIMKQFAHLPDLPYIDE